MNRFVLFSILSWCACMSSAQAQQQIKHTQSSNADLSTLEGVTLNNGLSTMRILSNVTIQKTTSDVGGRASANAVLPPTFLQRVGGYEIHRSNVSAVSSASVQASRALTVNGKAIPAFAEFGGSREYLGAAYLSDTKMIGLVSNEIVAKFTTVSLPAKYAGLGARELVPRSGLYLFVVSDVYAWIQLMSKLQSDVQVSVTQPRVVTELAQPQ